MRRATDPRDGGQGTRHRQVPAIPKPLLVTGDDGAFITFTPGHRSDLQTLKALRLSCSEPAQSAPVRRIERNSAGCRAMLRAAREVQPCSKWI